MLTSYATVEQLDEYATARGVTPASGDKTAALVRASMALDAFYESRYPGSRVSNSQSRGWPREDATWPDGEEISGTPDSIVWATCELALAELASPGILTPVVVPGKVKTRARVEGAVDVSYGSASADPVKSMVPVLTIVDGILLPLLGTRVGIPGVLVV